MPSRFKPSSRASRPSATSPEVLKRIKNVVLHEKYIDQLHNRDARRKFVAASSVGARVVKNGEGVKPGVIKAAKSALISEAKEVIIQFKHRQANSHCNCNIGYNDDCDIDDDEDVANDE